ncbi:ribonuclease HII [Saccharothrix coeruleofusca]|uniref:Ribonuclease HII n=1 Tax=Saccharothrix coeruleofusca TaxID=33919 RepID=A0A918EDW9_9PSEU|nr:ribonuclease HII [Saccharothrix coeruleofusca]MBP2338525.1 ribonuclease HII [Saccharothrix coeruleofusca]GGP47806.1 ribonuclease HII [Saccharothrix coeruleofusca]
MIRKPPRAQVRQTAGIWAFQAALDRRGLGPVAGVDEAGRGACAGPLVVASCVLRPGDAARFAGLTDSKLLTAAARDRMYDLLLERAVDYAVVVVPASEVDLIGVHVANIEGMRRAVAQLSEHPGYVLTDGFPVPGLTAPSTPVVKGDRVAACVAAASVLAKVTRDRIMTGLHEEFPVYGFDVHKGYSTAEHTAALLEHGPSAQHRWSYANVAAAAVRHGVEPPHRVARGVISAGVVQNGGPPQIGGGRLATRRGADSMSTRAEA